MYHRTVHREKYAVRLHFRRAVSTRQSKQFRRGWRKEWHSNRTIKIKHCILNANRFSFNPLASAKAAETSCCSRIERLRTPVPKSVMAYFVAVQFSQSYHLLSNMFICLYHTLPDNIERCDCKFRYIVGVPLSNWAPKTVRDCVLININDVDQFLNFHLFGHVCTYWNSFSDLDSRKFFVTIPSRQI